MGGRGASSMSSWNKLTNDVDLPVATPGTGGGGGAGASSDLPLTNDEKATLKEALGERGRGIGIADSAKGANPNYLKGKEYQLNCQRCVVAYELRRRGYDVVALNAVHNDKLAMPAPSFRTNNYHWQGAFRHAKVIDVSSPTRYKAPDKVRNKVLSEMQKMGHGSRAVLGFVWKVDRRAGHVINVENKKGVIHFIDAQTGQRYSEASLFSNIRHERVRLVRVDNLRISNRAKKAVKQAGA